MSLIRVFLADDSLLIREGVGALIASEEDFEVVGMAADYDELIAGVEESEPHVLVTDIRMPPNFQREGIDAAKEVRKSHPGTGVVILSQFDDPEYAISLLSDGASGYAYLLKDRVAEGDQLARAIREVAGGGSMLDPKIVEAMVSPVTVSGDLSPKDEELLRLVAEGKPIKAIASLRLTTPAAVSDEVEKLFLGIAEQASAGRSGALGRLKMLHQVIVDREETGESLSRLLPGGLAEKLRAEGYKPGDVEKLVVTVLMSDVRGYSGISEVVDPSELARLLHEHRTEMNGAILEAGGTIFEFIGDAVMAVFGAPFPQEDHADRAVQSALGMHQAQEELNARWASENLPPFGLGIGLSTGEVAAGLLGSEDRMEYSLVGDTVNLTQRLQDLARPSGITILSEATYQALRDPVDCLALGPQTVKGRQATVNAYRIPATLPEESST
jgi:class 3 adenylate cyclase/FixJ family two-component response regulator